MRRKSYKMRAAGQGGGTVEVSIPPQVIQREATRAGLNVKKFLEDFVAIAHYDGFDGVYYSFKLAFPEDHTLPQEVRLLEQDPWGKGKP